MREQRAANVQAIVLDAVECIALATFSALLLAASRADRQPHAANAHRQKRSAYSPTCYRTSGSDGIITGMMFSCQFAALRARICREF